MKQIYLVRHAETAKDSQRAPADWSLTDAGRLIASSLPDLPENVFSSPESKALETATLISTRPAQSIDEFREHLSGENGWLSQQDFMAAVEAYFARPQDRCWGDSHEETVARFRQGLSRLSAVSPDMDSCTVVTHGRIMASFLGSLNGTTGYDLWRMLTMPTVVRLGVLGDDFRIESITLVHP